MPPGARVSWSAQAKLALWIQKIGHGKTRRNHQFFIMLNESGRLAAALQGKPFLLLLNSKDCGALDRFVQPGIFDADTKHARLLSIPNILCCDGARDRIDCDFLRRKRNAGIPASDVPYRVFAAAAVLLPSLSLSTRQE